MADELAGVMLKIQRAYSHLAELQEAIETALDSSGERFSSEFDPESKQQVYRAHGLPEIDPKWSLMAGDILHNTRSALDHLAWQLVILDKGTPDRQTQFPIRETPFSKKGNLTATRLSPVKDPKILAALEECQPYRGADSEPAMLDRNHLWWLHRLNIIDKHRLLLLVTCVLDSNKMWWGGNATSEPAPGLRISTAPLKEESPVAWFYWGDSEPPPHFDPHLSLTISLNEPEVFGNLRMLPISLPQTLNAIINWVEQEVVMAHFEPLFA